MTGPTPRDWLDRLHALSLPRPFRIMNVCGGHERAISMTGLRTLLPDGVELIPGPGCPVCICPEEDIFAAIQLALRPEVTLVAFGDMLRVPCNAPKSGPRSLVEAKAAGGDVRPIATPAEAVTIARESPAREVVFFAAGFETTTAPVAAMLAQGVPDNLSVLLAARLTWPAVAMLLESGAPGFDALVGPGHVAAVMGPEEWRFVPETHGIPAAVAGFTAESLTAAFYAVARQRVEGRVTLDNCYPSVVRPDGNPTARRVLSEVMEIVPAEWRGIGTIPGSGYALAADFARHDARARFGIDPQADRKRAGEMPPGCDCAGVVLGRIKPDQCRLYGAACTPRAPVGPCMVSDEGACHIWWQAGIRKPAPERQVAEPAHDDA